jgi:hypothetical protein
VLDVARDLLDIAAGALAALADRVCVALQLCASGRLMCRMRAPPGSAGEALPQTAMR